MTGDVSKTLNSIRSDSDHVPCVLVVMAYNYDSYNQVVTKNICQSLKAVQGGDDIPRVLVVYETDNTNRKEIL